MRIDLGPLSDFPEGSPVLRKDAEGRRYACVREGASVHAIDDACPHQGYPLSQGCVKGGVLTCAWHNWKFDLASGACTFGGEAVRRYPTRVEDGRVHLERVIDRGAEARRLTKSLREALVKDEAPRALREALRLGALGIGASDPGIGRLALGFELLARDGAERAEYGFDHGLALLADLVAWVERGVVGGEEGFVQAARAIAEPSRNLGVRGTGTKDARASLAQTVEIDPADPARIARALVEERREEAELLVRALVETRGPEATCAALMPFVSAHLLDYGHGAIFLAKALELARRFPSAAIPLFGSLTAMLGWATADTALPPFTATRKALEELAALPLVTFVPVAIQPGFEARVLAGEREALSATMASLREGAPPVALLRRVARAAATRIRRFDSAWEHRLDAEVSVLDVTHALTFAEAAITLSETPGTTGQQAARLTLLAAGFVGKLRRADASEPLAATQAEGSLVDAVVARDAGRALAIAATLDRPARLAAFVEIGPFAAMDAAVRPIFYAHTVKVTEALRRLAVADPDADALYLEALLVFLAPRRPETRGRRIAAVAKKFLEDGRPPEGLY
jgi:nitrite reductase/ring-hydroxylating ferredoxin subunit